MNIIVLDEFFRKLMHTMKDNELMAIIRRIDTEGDAQINFNEFADFMKTDSEVSLAKSLPAALSSALYDPYNSYYRYISPTDIYPYYHHYPYYSTVPRYYAAYTSPRTSLSATKSRSKSVAEEIADYHYSVKSPYRSLSYWSPYLSRYI